MASSVAFPAFERAQQEHMNYDNNSAQNLYDSIAQTLQDSLSQPTPPQPPPPLPLSSSSHARVSSSIDLTKARDAAPLRPSPAKPKITKRTNARLQLAAALIEADNDRIIQKAQVWHIYHPDQGKDAPRPPPPPEPALASQSAIFAPFRQDAPPSLTRHVRTWSAATGLSQLLGPRNDGSRPSIDFLGVALPTEKRSRSRATSSVGLGGDHHSRTDSLFSNGGTSILARPSLTLSRSESRLSGAPLADAMDGVDADDDALSAWGVDKFLSKEAKERIASGQRSRAESLAAVPSKRFSLHHDDTATESRSAFAGRRSLDLDRAGSVAPPMPTKAKSDIAASASTPADLGKQNSKLELLAKIKLYRERQENLPPSLWDGPGPTASKEEVADHILGISAPPLSERDANRDDAQHNEHESAAKTAELESKGHRKAAASSSSTSILDRPRPFSRNDSISSSNLVGTPSQTDSRELATTTASISGPSQLYKHAGAATDSDVDFFGADLAKTLRKDAYSIATPDQLDRAISEPPSQLQPQSQPTAGALGYHAEAQISDIAVDKFDENGELLTMAGIGSYSRSQSRRNSTFGASLPIPHGDGGDASLTSPQLRPQSLLPGQHLPYQPNVGSPLATPDAGRLSARMSRALQDPFSEHDLGLGPSPFAAAVRAASSDFVAADPSSRRGSVHDLPPSKSFDTHGLTTKQLQTIARNSTFPSHLGINRDLLDDTIDEDFEEENEFGKLLRPSKVSLDAASLSEDIARTGGENFEIRLGGGAAPDLSSANWGKPRKKWFRLSTMADAKGKVKKPKKTTAPEDTDLDSESDADVLQDAALAAVPLDEKRADHTHDPSESYAAEPAARIDGEGTEGKTKASESQKDGADEDPDIDDDYISPPRKGRLRPLGLSNRLPQTLVMPPPLQGTDLAPKLRLTESADHATARPVAAAKRHSLHVPDGFVLHDSRGGLPPMRSIVVHSANGPRPMFAAKPGSKKHEQAITELKAIEVGRTVQVPAAAPRGIGRRAAVPTTALFRNQLVQHDDEREGWGWEMGSRADDAFDPNAETDSDDDDKPLADLKKKSRSAKKAAKKLAKQKRKRKAARRIRRAKREEAIRDGKSFQEVGVDELSPDEDLDLSSTTSEEEVTDSETDSDFWASDDDKRWVDDLKPAGKLYGKSLLDIAAERNTERKSKARFYGQVQLEDDAPTPLLDLGDEKAAPKTNLNVADDAASVAPSVAKSFRDKPLGYNDTRERMEAVFGADKVWEREMARRKEEEAREAEEQKARKEAEALEAALQAQKKAKKEKAFFSLGKKSGKNKTDMLGINESMAGSSVSLGGSYSGERSSNAGARVQDGEDAAAPQKEGGDEPNRSHTPVEPPVLAVDVVEDAEEGATPGGRRSFALLEGVQKEAQEWLIESDHESVHDKSGVGKGSNSGDDDDDDDDDVPLSQVKKTVASRPVSLAPGMMPQIGNAAEESSDEELPLAALKEKRARQSMLSFGGGKLDLDFASPSNSPERKGRFEDGANRTPSNMLGQSPMGSLHLNGSWVRSASQNEFPRSPLSREVSSQRLGLDDSDSEDDLPLGQQYAGGADALAAVRTTLEQKKKEAKEAKKLQRKADRAAVRAAARAAKKTEAAANSEKRQDSVDVDLKPNDGEKENSDGESEDGREEDEGTDSNSDSEDDKPLGYVHPQAAIIAEQAALIRQLQAEKEQQQQHHTHSPSGSGILSPPTAGINVGTGMGSGFWNGINGMDMANAARASMMGLPTTQSMMGMGMGASMNTGMGMGMGLAPAYDGMPAASVGLPISMSMPSMGMNLAAAGMPGSPGSQLGFGGGAALAPAMVPGPRMSSMGMSVASVGVPMMPTTAPNPMSMLLDPKVSSIHNWRTQVPPDATATSTPSSAVNSRST